MSHQLQGKRAGLINQEWDKLFLDGLANDPDALAEDSHTIRARSRSRKASRW